MKSEQSISRGSDLVQPGIFATLFAESCENSWTVPQGSYDPETQLFIDPAGSPALVCHESTGTVKTTYCSTKSECGTGKGSEQIIDDASTDFSACDTE